MSKSKRKILTFIAISVIWVIYFKTYTKEKKIALETAKITDSEIKTEKIDQSVLKKCTQYAKGFELAPPNIYNKKNPRTSKEDILIGAEFFNKRARPLPCKECHGKDGKGHVPYKIVCKDLKDKITAGQMFWSMKNNISVTGLAEHKKTLSDTELWQVVAFIEAEIGKRQLTTDY